MKLSEFIECSKKDLDSFSVFWKEGFLKNPNHFPLEMEEGDWFEQLITYFSSDIQE